MKAREWLGYVPLYLGLAGIVALLQLVPQARAEVVNNTNTPNWSLTSRSPNGLLMFATDRLKADNKDAEYLNPSNNAMVHILKQMPSSDVNRLDLAAYFSTKDGNDKYIKILKSSRDICNFEDVPAGKFITIELTAGSVTRRYSVPYERACLTNNEDYVNIDTSGPFGSSDNNRLFGRYPIDDMLSSQDDAVVKDVRSGRYKVAIRITLDSSVAAESYNSGPRKNEEKIRRVFLRVVAANPGVATDPKLGSIEAPAGAARRNFGLVAEDNTPGTGVRFSIPFGVECNYNSSNPLKLTIYDPDNHVFGLQYVRIAKKDNSNVTSWLKNSEYSGLSGAVSFRNDSNANRNEGLVINQRTSGNNATFSVKNPDPKYRYLFVLSNPSNGRNSNNPDTSKPYTRASQNVFSLGIPKESIYGDEQCRPAYYELAPKVQIASPVPAIYPYKANLRLNASVSNEGDTTKPTGGHDWGVIVAKYAPNEPDPIAAYDAMDSGALKVFDRSARQPCGANSVLPGTASCGWFSPYLNNSNTPEVPPAWEYFAAAPGDKTNEPYSKNTVDPLGTRVCFVAVVEHPTGPEGPFDDDKYWRYGDMTCAVSGKQPKIQVKGHDLRTTGAINTSNVTDDSDKYGSWGEYGVLSNGCNVSNTTDGPMGSGASLFGGRNVGNTLSLNRLTFANAQGAFPDPCLYGNFGDIGAFLADSFKTESILDDKSGEPADVNLPAKKYGPGDKKVLYYPNSTITIKADADGNGITYDADGYTSVGQLPYIVIIAKNILIDKDVKRIDAWLIARADGGAAPSGNITTCDIGTANYDWANANLDANGGCKEKLIFNGPVMANKIFLYRTAGSTDTNLDDPAEVFNLRADIWLSALAGTNNKPVATTETIAELPPRF